MFCLNPRTASPLDSNNKNFNAPSRTNLTDFFLTTIFFESGNYMLSHPIILTQQNVPGRVITLQVWCNRGSRRSTAGGLDLRGYNLARIRTGWTGQEQKLSFLQV